MTASPLPPVWRTVRWPVLFSLVVLAVRLVGELAGWDPMLFSRAAGGGGAIVGIGWLMPVFGFWFGWKVTGAGHAPDRPGLALILLLLGVAAMIGGMVFATHNLKPPTLFVAFAVIALVAITFAWRAWPELLRYTLAYAIAVRLVVVAITAVAVWMKLGTHFDSVPDDPANAAMTQLDKFVGLASAQVTIWIAGTALFGGLAGTVASFLRGRRADDARDD